MEWHTLLAIASVVVVARFCGTVAVRLSQARVLGEVMAGVLLGPSLLGVAWPAAQGWLFEPGVRATMETLAQLGVLVFVFLVGMESAAPAHSVPIRPVVAISCCGLVVPFAFGVLLAVILARIPQLGLTPDGNVTFSLFIGLSLSVTALPVLARLVTDLELEETRLGALALRCAAVTDLACWCLLGVVSVTAGGRSVTGVVVSLCLTVLVAVVLMGCVRRRLDRLGGRSSDRLPEGLGAGLLAAMLFSAAFTDSAGVHSVLGAFLFGATVPKSLREKLGFEEKLRPLASWLLLPLFFCSVGLGVRLDVVVASPALLAVSALVVVFAVLGKWLGTGLAARLIGYSWKQANLLAALLNCRGLTELVVLDVGLRMGILTNALFSVFVVMTLVTTVASSIFGARGRDFEDLERDGGEAAGRSDERPRTFLTWPRPS